MSKVKYPDGYTGEIEDLVAEYRRNLEWAEDAERRGDEDEEDSFLDQLDILWYAMTEAERAEVS